MVDSLKLETLCLHGGYGGDPETRSRAVPIYQTASYLFRDTAHAARLFDLGEAGSIYTRINNPTTGILEERLALLEGGVGALAVASGQAAVALTVLALAGPGDEIVASSRIYGGTHTLLKTSLGRLGIHTRFVGDPAPDRIEAALTDRTKAILVEVVGNPSGVVVDLPRISAVTHRLGIPLVVDATTVTPWLCRPIEYGADIVIHSATKFIGGHGTSIGGCIVDSGTFPWNNGRFPAFTEPSESYHGLCFWDAFRVGKDRSSAFIIKVRAEGLRDFGPALSPFNAFLFLQGLETLPLRMEKHCANALAVARFLQGHPKVAWVSYPGLEDHPSHRLAETLLPKGAGAILTFGAVGGREASERVVNRVRLISLLANIGDARTLIIHPASTTHRQLSEEELAEAGIAPDAVRLSVGLEHLDDILEDLNQALEGT